MSVLFFHLARHAFDDVVVPVVQDVGQILLIALPDKTTRPRPRSKLAMIVTRAADKLWDAADWARCLSRASLHRLPCVDERVLLAPVLRTNPQPGGTAEGELVDSLNTMADALTSYFNAGISEGGPSRAALE